MIILIFLMPNKNFSQTVDDPTDIYNGVWAYSNGGLGGLLGVNGNIKGALAKIRWSDLQPTATGPLNWSFFQSQLQLISDYNLEIGILIWVGPDAPAWIYNTPYNVPKITTDDQNPFPYFPYYLNTTYTSLFYKLIDSVSAHIDLLPAGIRNKIIFYQSCEGKTGDTGPYDGKPDSLKYKITDAQWSDYKHNIWKHLDTLYKNKSPKIHLLLNQGNDLAEDPWINTNLPLSWRKAANQGDGYQLNDEENSYNALYNNINAPQGNCATKVRSRAEMDAFESPYYQKAPRWNFYWHALAQLHFGLDTWQIVNNELDNSTYFPGYDFYAKYAGEKDPACSQGAFCALRDGLDASDFTRFDVATYGNGTIDAFGSRALSIANFYASFGAKQPDTVHSNGSAMNQKYATDMNDVSWNTISGNYERYLSQWNANGTSVGYWRVGSITQEYGRFARGFQHSSSKDSMHFDVKDSILYKNNGVNAIDIDVRVVYYDTSIAKWQLIYDAIGNTKKVGATVTNTNSGIWKDTIIHLTDAYFGNRGTHGSDLKLVNKKSTDNLFHNAIFHMIEITKSANTPKITEAYTKKQNVNNKIKVYPNPASNVFSISLINKQQLISNVKIYNPNGTKVFDKNVNNSELKISTHELGNFPGVYLIEVLDNSNNLVREKIIIQ